MEYAVMACRVGLIGVFVAAVAKLGGRASWSGFVGMVRATRLVPARLVTAVSAAVALAELAVVVLLAVPRTARLGFAVSTVLLVAFTVGTAVLVRRGDPVACHCFGRSDIAVGPVHVWRDGLLLLCAAVGATAPDPARLPVAGLVASITAGAAGAMGAVFLADLVQLFSGRTGGAIPSPPRSLP